MKVFLFGTCLVDTFFPEAGGADLRAHAVPGSIRATLPPADNSHNPLVSMMIRFPARRSYLAASRIGSGA